MVWKTVKWWAFFLATWDRIEESRLKLQSYLCVRNKSLSKPSFSSSHYHQCALRANKVIPWISRFRSRQYILGSFGLLPPPPPPPTSTIARWLPAPPASTTSYSLVASLAPRSPPLPPTSRRGSLGASLALMFPPSPPMGG